MQPTPPSPFTTLSQLAADSAFPLYAVPRDLQNAIRYLENEDNIPEEVVVNAIFTAVSLACQPHIAVMNPYTGIPEPCALFLMTLAPSGAGKTTVLSQVLKPFYAFETESHQEYQDKLAAFHRDHRIWKTRLQALETSLRTAIRKGHHGDNEQAALAQHSGNKPACPTAPDLIYSDTTAAALIEGLSQYPSAALILDETSLFYGSNLKDYPGLFNKAWDGGVYTHKRHHHTHRFSPVLTVSLMLQPPVFMEYMKKQGADATESGFLPRFLFASTRPPVSQNHSIAPMGYRYHIATPARDESALRPFHQRIELLLAKQKQHIQSGLTEKKMLCLTPEAESYWENKRHYWISLTTPGQCWAGIHYMVQKANTNMLRVAALLHYFTDQESDSISREIIEQAGYIMEWYLRQAASWFYQFSDEYKFQQDVHLLHQWIYQRFMSGGWAPFKKNDVIKYGPNRLRRSDKLEPLLNHLINQGVIGYVCQKPGAAVYISYPVGQGYFAGIPSHSDNSQQPPTSAPKNTSSNSQE